MIICMLVFLLFLLFVDVDYLVVIAVAVSDLERKEKWEAGA